MGRLTRHNPNLRQQLEPMSARPSVVKRTWDGVEAKACSV
jgi:hypothetical protein